MLNITRFNPLEDALDNLCRGLTVWLPNPERHAAAPTQFRMDVTENDKEYQVLADLPGVKKEDINITINGNEGAVFFFSSRRRHTRFDCDWSSDVCSSD